MSKPIRIIRAPYESLHFVNVRSTPQDRTLSWEARGVLWYLLSQADVWEVQPLDLQQGCGSNRVYKILKELQDHHYVEKIIERDDKKKFVRFTYRVYEEPFDEKPQMGLPQMGKPLMENPPLNKSSLSLSSSLLPNVLAVSAVGDQARTDELRIPPTATARTESHQADLEAFHRRKQFYQAFEAAFPETARTKVSDTKANKAHARDLFLAGYSTDEVTAVVKAKLEQGKTDYRFHYLMADLAEARLKRNSKPSNATPTSAVHRAPDELRQQYEEVFSGR